MSGTELPGIKEQLNEAYTTKLFFTDLNGRLKNLSVNPNDIESILNNGVGIDGSSIAGIATVDNSDRILKPVIESFRLVDFGDRKVGFFVGQIFNSDGSRSEADPRYPLERAVEQAARDCKIKFMWGRSMSSSCSMTMNSAAKSIPTNLIILAHNRPIPVTWSVRRLLTF